MCVCLCSVCILTVPLSVLLQLWLIRSYSNNQLYFTSLFFFPPIHCVCVRVFEPPPPSPLHHHLLSSEWAANLPAFTPLFSPCADWEIKQWLFESGPDTDTHSLICIKNKWRCYSPNDSITITNALSVSARVSSSCWVMLRVVMHMRFQPGRLQFCTGTLLLHSSTFNKLAAFCLQNICFTVYIRTTQTAAQNAELVRASSIVFISEHPYCKLRKLCFILPHVDKQWERLIGHSHQQHTELLCPAGWLLPSPGLDLKNHLTLPVSAYSHKQIARTH